MKLVETEGRRKAEGLRKIPRRRKENYFLDALWFGTLSLAFLGFILIVEEVLGAVFGIFWASLGLAQSNFFAARWFLGSIKFRLWHFLETLQVRSCQSWAPP